MSCCLRAKPAYKPVSRLYTPRLFQPGACKVRLAKFGMALKVAQHFRLPLFAFSPSLYFRFPCLIFFFLIAGHLVGFILGGRVSKKPFIILELGAQKGMEQAFYGDFRSVLHWFSWPFLQFP